MIPDLREKFFERLEEIEELPTLPLVIGKLNKALEDANTNAEIASNIIKDDPAMMAKILKTVNSGLYGFSEEITSIAQAVSLLGFVAVKNIAITTSVFSTFDINEQKDFNREEFWKHSICVGIAMNYLYERLKSNLQGSFSPDILHLAGLLHGIGIIVLEEYFHIKFIFTILNSKKKKIALVESEKEQFGADHAEVGAWLAEKWSLPPIIKEVVRNVYTPEKAEGEYRELVNLCHTAKFICNLENLGNYGEIVPPFKKHVMKELGFKLQEVTSIIDDVKKEAEKSEIIMAITRGE